MVTEQQTRLQYALRGARLYDVPVELVMPCAMLHNWRRRTKRLERAFVRAAGDPARQRAVRMAHNRLTNLRSPV